MSKILSHAHTLCCSPARIAPALWEMLSVTTQSSKSIGTLSSLSVYSSESRVGMVIKMRALCLSWIRILTLTNLWTQTNAYLLRFFFLTCKKRKIILPSYREVVRMRETKPSLRPSTGHLVIAQSMADVALNACCALHVYWRLAWMPC